MEVVRLSLLLRRRKERNISPPKLTKSLIFRQEMERIGGLSQPQLLSLSPTTILRTSRATGLGFLTQIMNPQSPMLSGVNCIRR